MALLIVVGLTPCFILKIGILKNYERRAVQNRIVEAETQCNILANQLGSQNYLEEPKSEVIDGELTQLSNMYNGRILIIDKNFKILKDTYALEEGKLIVSSEVIRCFKGENTENYDNKKRYIEVSVPIPDSVSQETDGVMLMSLSSDSIIENMNTLDSKANILLAIIGSVVVILAIILASVLVKPFGNVTKSIEALTDGYLDENISIPDYTETELIAEAFNKMLSRMKVLDDSRQEFVSNVSHELKTPITSMKVLADSLLAQEDVPAELYKEFMSDIAEEIERENKIINDLLSLVKMDKTANTVNIASCNINELLEIILKRLRPIAAKRNIELVFESFRPVTAEVDEMKLSLALSNLVENAVKYNRDDGWVHVSLNADHKYFYVKVADSGIGIPEDETEHIFERFYRVDKSHSRQIGGTGLGLAITRNAIVMHRGAIKVYSKEGEGTTFTVRIPLIYIT